MSAFVPGYVFIKLQYVLGPAECSAVSRRERVVTRKSDAVSANSNRAGDVRVHGGYQAAAGKALLKIGKPIENDFALGSPQRRKAVDNRKEKVVVEVGLAEVVIVIRAVR